MFIPETRKNHIRKLIIAVHCEPSVLKEAATLIGKSPLPYIATDPLMFEHRLEDKLQLVKRATEQVILTRIHENNIALPHYWETVKTCLTTIGNQSDRDILDRVPRQGRLVRGLLSQLPKVQELEFFGGYSHMCFSKTLSEVIGQRINIVNILATRQAIIELGPKTIGGRNFEVRIDHRLLF